MPLRLNRVSFLIVDDNEHIRRLVRLILRSTGAVKLMDASDGAEAIKAMRKEVPDILITDWAMAPMDGLELAHFVRTSPQSPNPFMPIIMMTGHTERERVFSARDAGINEFLAKPLTAGALYSRIYGLIDAPRAYVRGGGFFGPDRRRHNKDLNLNDRRGQPARARPAPLGWVPRMETARSANP